MKKIYEKPHVYIEKFELSEHIAGDCNWDYNGSTNPESCVAVGKLEGVEFEVKLFASANSACEVDGAYCDYTPDGVSATFNS